MGPVWFGYGSGMAKISIQARADGQAPVIAV